MTIQGGLRIYIVELLSDPLHPLIVCQRLFLCPKEIHMILVVGSTGFLGEAICHKLAKQGHKVRALVRASSNPETLQRLAASGVETVLGDLRQPETLGPACWGVQAVISTATTTARQDEGNTIPETDQQGQLNLVAAAKEAGVGKFVFISYSGNIDAGRKPSPLTQAKRSVEEAVKLSGMAYTILRPSYFMEVWLSPAIGFDYPNAKATIYGEGKNKISWISIQDVAEMTVLALDHLPAQNKVIELGGPASLSPLDAVGIFERVTGRKFEIQMVPEAALEAQQASATDPLAQSFSALMVGYARGDSIPMQETAHTFNLQLTSVEDYARSAL
jgi:uncharacterized protein YbjT (DUF2867 family)